MYLIHVPRLIENGDYEGAWKELEKIKEVGLSKYVHWSTIRRGLTWRGISCSLGALVLAISPSRIYSR
jgi:hypothetical protein